MEDTILVVEDEQALQDVVKKKLELTGFKVVTARSVDEALDSLKATPKIVGVWLDHYLLGQENGLDFVAKVKAHEDWKQIPVFVISNTASQDKVSAYLELGIDRYYTKADYRLDQIIAELVKHINEHKEGKNGTKNDSSR